MSDCLYCGCVCGKGSLKHNLCNKMLDQFIIVYTSLSILLTVQILWNYMGMSLVWQHWNGSISKRSSWIGVFDLCGSRQMDLPMIEFVRW